jgi:hypothetical protein
MDPAEKQAILFLVAIAPVQQQQSPCVYSSSLQHEDGPKWIWKPYKRYTIKKLVDVWADEDDGGFNDNLFEFFTRFRKDEVKQLASLLDVPTAFAIDKRTGYPNAVTQMPAEALWVFLWGSAHPSALAHLIC